MKRNNSNYSKIIFSLLLVFLSSLQMLSQNKVPKDTTASKEIEELKILAGQMVSELEGMLNLIGDKETPVIEKEIIIKESYAVFFLNDKVQVQDDLDENREMPINKDVQAYLKDIEFFYKHVNFTFTIQEVNHFVTEDDKLFFIVTFNRNLKGVSITNDTIDNNQVRYAEINYTKSSNSIKIASIYTTKLNEDEDLRIWWNELSTEWKNFLGNSIKVYDSIPLAEIEKIEDTMFVFDDNEYFADAAPLYQHLNLISKKQEIDLSEHNELTDLKPLSKLTELRVVNISNTRVDDIIPLRNLTKLEVLKCSGTNVDILSPLRYATSLKELECANTPLYSLEPLKNFAALKLLDCSKTQVSDLLPVQGLTKLRGIKINDTKISDLKALEKLDSLEMLNASNTSITFLGPLKELKKLKIILFDNTTVSSLAPLDGIDALEKVYCDNTNIIPSEAKRFLSLPPHKDCLIIYASEDLKNWWESELPSAWQIVFKSYVDVDDPITKEQLHQIANIEEIDISSNSQIQNLNPLSKLINLKKVNCQDTKVDRLGALKHLVYLEELNCSHSPVVSVDPLKELRNLKILNCEYTEISSLDPILALKDIKVLYLDNTPVSQQTSNNSLQIFILQHPDCLVIHETGKLNIWWEHLSEDWQKCFSKIERVDNTPTKEQLHKVVSIKKIDISGNTKLNDISPLKKLKKLEELHVSRCNISSLSDVSHCKGLKILDCSKNPIQTLEPLKSLDDLHTLNCENTQIESIEPLKFCSSLKILSCAGTRIKSLKGIEYVYKLNDFDCSNTDIRNLKQLMGLKKLRSLKCFNTKLSDKKVSQFKEACPSVEVEYY